MVDPQGWILSGPSRRRSSPGSPARFPKADGCSLPSVPAQFGRQGAARNPSTDNGQPGRLPIRSEDF